MSEDITMREKWLKEITWIITDQPENKERNAAYKAEHVFELLSKNIFNTSERDDFKRLSVALSDYLKALNFSEEMGQLQLLALSFAFGFYYRKLEEKNIVKVEVKNENVIENADSVSPSSSTC
jgi:hypothetical protein